MALATVRGAVAALGAAVAAADPGVFSRARRRSVAWLALRALGAAVRAHVGGDDAVLVAACAPDAFVAAAARRGVCAAVARSLYRRARRRLIFPRIAERRVRRRRAAARVAAEAAGRGGGAADVGTGAGGGGSGVGGSGAPQAAQAPRGIRGAQAVRGARAARAALVARRRDAAAALADSHAAVRRAAAAAADERRDRALRSAVGAAVAPPLDADAGCVVCAGASWSSADAHERLYRPACCLVSPLCGGCAASVVASDSVEGGIASSARCPACRRGIGHLQQLGRGRDGRWRARAPFVAVDDFASGWVRSRSCSKLCCRELADSQEPAGEGEEDCWEDDVLSVDSRPCALCGRDDEHELLLECSGCLQTLAHTFCLVPRLASPPAGHWLCWLCSAELGARCASARRVEREAFVARATAGFVAAKAAARMRGASKHYLPAHCPR